MTKNGETVFLAQHKKADAIWVIQQLCHQFYREHGRTPDLLCIHVSLQPSIEAALELSSSNPFPVPSHEIRWYFVDPDLDVSFQYAIIAHKFMPGRQVAL